MVVQSHVSEEAFRRVALRDPDGHWELHDGQLQEKPPMSFAHNWLMVKLGYLLLRQLDWKTHQVRINAGHVYPSPSNYFIPDLFVLPTEIGRHLQDRSDLLEVYDQPLPLVVEVWSPSTGSYDVDAKLPAYQARGDEEIWRVHPYEKTVTVWQRQEDGSYRESIHRDGSIAVASLPSAVIELAELFDE